MNLQWNCKQEWIDATGLMTFSKGVIRPFFWALPQNLWVDSDWCSVAFQGWHNLDVFAHAESRARNFFRHPLLLPMIFCI